jgi:hypothetical protein
MTTVLIYRPYLQTLKHASSLTIVVQLRVTYMYVYCFGLCKVQTHLSYPHNIISENSDLYLRGNTQRDTHV